VEVDPSFLSINKFKPMLLLMIVARGVSAVTDFLLSLKSAAIAD
jgi:hypothetical protein